MSASKCHFDHLDHHKLTTDGKVQLAPGVDLVVTADCDDHEVCALLDRVAAIYDREQHLRTINAAIEECIRVGDAEGLDDVLVALGWTDNLSRGHSIEAVTAVIRAVLPLSSTWSLFTAAETADLVSHAIFIDEHTAARKGRSAEAIDDEQRGAA